MGSRVSRSTSLTSDSQQSVYVDLMGPWCSSFDPVGDSASSADLISCVHTSLRYLGKGQTGTPLEIDVVGEHESAQRS